MLYQRWLETVRENRNVIALSDHSSSRSWTFAQLAAEVDRSRPAAVPVVYPCGLTPDFVLSVLRGWRDGKVVCPLETGQTLPDLTSLVNRSESARVVHLKTTSATGGVAKAILFTAEQLAADAENVVTTMGLRPDWPNLGVISLAHSYGFSNLVTPLLLQGIPLILVPAPLPETVRLATATVANVTLAAVPAMWRAWHAADAVPPNVRLAISAGAPLPLALEQEVFKRHSLKIHNFYGASECGGIAFDGSEEPRSDAAYIGSPLKNVSLSLADDGCLEVRSKAVAEGYWPDAASGLGGGWFHSSDLAELQGGEVFLRGRVGDQINVAGRKVSPEIIERALLMHPQIKECLVFGVTSRDTERTEEIVAIVISAESTEGLRRLATENLPGWQIPRHWHLVQKLQTNARGKISRAEWRRFWIDSIRGSTRS